MLAALEREEASGLASSEQGIQESVTSPPFSETNETSECKKVTIEELHRLYFDHIIRFAYAKTSSHEDAEEITQDTFLRAYRALDRLKHGQNLQAWLYRIAERLIIDHYRKRAAHRMDTTISLDTEDAPDIEASDDFQGQCEQREIIQHVLRAMPIDHRTSLLLWFEHGYQGVMRRYGGDKHAACMRITRAKYAFRKAYRKIEGINTPVSDCERQQAA